MVLASLWVAVCLSAPTAFAALEETFRDEFEDRGPGDFTLAPGAWTVTGDGMFELKDGIGFSATRGLEIATDSGQSAEVAYDHGVTHETALWTEMEAKLAPHAPDANPPAVPESASVAFHLTTTGDVKARDGNTWISLGLNLDTAQLHRYVFKQDYLAQTWTLWIDGNLVTPAALAFANPQQAPDKLRIVQDPGHTSVLDHVAIRRNAPSGLTGIQDFDAWSSGIAWNGADPTLSADPNANNLSNLLEYAFGFPNPVNGAHTYQTGLQFDEGNAMLEITYRRNRQAEDLVYLVQSSGDLNEWTNIWPAPNAVTISPIDATTDAVTVQVPANGDQLFLRIDLLKP